MNPEREHLDRLYTLTLQTDTEREFYMAVYEYCSFVMKNPILNDILEADGKRYRLAHSDIWRERSRTDGESDMKADMTTRIERFSLYCDFSLLMMRIYYPLEDYSHDAGPENKQDPAAVVMIRGLKEALKYKKWDKDTLGSFNRWYEGKRSLYEATLRKFHIKMLAALWDKNESSEQVLPRPRPNLSFSDSTGDFYVNGVYGNFNPRSQEAKVFGILCRNPDHMGSYPELVRAFRPEAKEVSKAHKDDLSKLINSIKQALGTQRDVIQNVKGVGYRLVFPALEENRE